MSNDPSQPVASGEDVIETRHTRVEMLAQTLRDSVADYLSGGTAKPCSDPERDAALAESRRLLRTQIEHDLVFNRARLGSFAEEVAQRVGNDSRVHPVVADGLRRLESAETFLRETDPYASSQVEEQYWITLQQFYCDALDLAERLVRAMNSLRRRFEPAPRSDGTFKRYNFLGIEAYNPLQAAANAAEVAVPNVTEMRFWSTMAPTLFFMLKQELKPWAKLRWADFERTCRGWLSRSGFSKLRGGTGGEIIFRGREVFEDNDELVDSATGQTRHNLIVAASHRAGFLDFPLFAEIFRRTKHGVWTNNAFYTPAMARKMAASGTVIPVRGQGKPRMKDILDASVKMLAIDRMPLFLLADGSQPNMMYGYQVSVKRGLRLLVDETIRQSQGTGRKTYVIPMTFDDPLGYLLGLDDRLVVTAHRPLEIDEPSSAEPYRSAFDEAAINGGDDLLNHLEALYFVNSMQPRHGLRTPDVLAAVRRKCRSDGRRGLRAWLRGKLNTSVYDLSRAE